MKIFAKLMLFAALAAAIAAAACFAYYIAVTRGAVLDEDKLTLASGFAEVYAADASKAAEISPFGADKKVRLKELPPYVKNAFIAAEDKKFYRHGGLDYARMLKAAAKNISARSFCQGASTISQQLIKNTHLTSEKTLKRKLMEIRLTKKLERAFGKDEILELYLNSIYFGHNCYGIAGASELYFGKPAEEMTIGEGAMLAAIIPSPNRYSPFADREKCRAARSRVLGRMQALGYITEGEADRAAKEELPERRQGALPARSYLQCVADELETLGLTGARRFAAGGCKIYTYLSPSLQEYVENLQTDADRAGKSIVVEDNASCGICACFLSEGNLRRQPGSVLKPLAVYAPAIEKGILSACTPILDEKTNFQGYSPANYKDKYCGYVSARQALAESLNVPAVKTLVKLGVDESERFLGRMGLDILAEDKNLSLALGGTRSEFTLAELVGAYALFAGGGEYLAPAFISRIEGADGRILYERDMKKRAVFSEDTAYIVGDMLRAAAESGTAKKLSVLPFPVCAKTGTVGSEKGNTDAYTIAYTGGHTVGVWMGNADRSLTDITGGGLPCHYAMLIHRFLCRGTSPKALPACRSVHFARIDKIAYEREHRVLLAPAVQPQKYTLCEVFRKDALPKEYSERFLKPHIDASIRCDGKHVYIDICQTEYFDMIVKRRENGKTKELYRGKARPFCDTDVRADTRYDYTVIPCFTDDDGKTHCGKEIALPGVLIGKKQLARIFN